MSFGSKFGYVGRKGLRFLFYPIIRPIEGIAEAGSELGKTIGEAKERIADQSRREIDPGELEPGDLRALRDPQARFAEFSKRMNFSEELILKRYTTFRVSKYAMMLSSAVFLIGGGVANYFFVPLIFEAVGMGVALLASSISFAKAIEMDLYCVQLRDRALYSFSQYLARPHFVQHLFLG